MLSLESILTLGGIVKSLNEAFMKSGYYQKKRILLEIEVVIP